jgi:hypothetical protein
VDTATPLIRRVPAYHVHLPDTHFNPKKHPPMVKVSDAERFSLWTQKRKKSPGFAMD